MLNDLPPFPFPGDFLWGVATSSYQIEGAVKEDGRGESIWDAFCRLPGKIEDGSDGSPACDHYHHWKEDIELMRWLNVRAYRFSIAWPRIFPDGRGAPNPTGLDFYDRLVDGLLAAGLAPFVTLYHWDLPQALQELGGWANRDTAAAFVDYAAAVARRLGDRASGWMTHNEPWCASILGHFKGIHAPGIQDLGVALRAAHNILLSHGLAVPVLRELARPEAMIGIVLNLVPAYPASERPEDASATHRWDGFFNRWFLDPLAGRGYPEDMWELYGQAAPEYESGDLQSMAAPIDFLGVNYYHRVVVTNDPRGKPVQTLTLAEQEKVSYPEGLYAILDRVHRNYPFPALYITENGTASIDQPGPDGCIDDQPRLEYIRAHIAQARRAVAAGIPLKGYFFWSLMDNFEWAMGYTMRFGLFYVDYTSQQRIPKKSAHWLREFLSSSRSQQAR